MKKIKEDVAYGIYDRPGPGIEDEPSSFENPISPGPQMSIQLSSEKPPIEDEDYVPTSSSALSLAASEIANSVPDDQIEFFYRSLHRLLDKATDRSAMEIKEEEMQQEGIKKKIRSVLIEMVSEQEEFSPQDLERMQADFDEEFGSSGAPSAAADKPDTKPDESNLENLAKQFGFSGPSGIRQFINRILKRLGFTAEVLDNAAIESLMSLAVPEYISEMFDGDYIDEEDVADLKQSPNIIRGLPSFQFFFVSGFILPAYREFSRNINNSVRAAIDTAGIPKSAKDMVFNQATGLAEKDPGAIREKLSKAVSSGEMSSGDYEKVSKAARSIALFSKKNTPDAAEFVEVATDRWQGLSRSRRQGILKKALEETLAEMS